MVLPLAVHPHRLERDWLCGTILDMVVVWLLFCLHIFAGSCRASCMHASQCGLMCALGAAMVMLNNCVLATAVVEWLRLLVEQTLKDATNLSV